jgi:protein-L-isoaspartate(D-aspartate) O-methyltransferase
MVDLLRLDPEDKVLEVGGGSGYAAAIMAHIAARVIAIEKVRSLAEQASKRLADLGYDNVEVRQGDGTLGCPEEAPFDAITAAAAAPSIPESFEGQLAPGGRIVLPVGTPGGFQRLVRIVRTADGESRVEELDPVRFVPLVGEFGSGKGRIGR